MAISEQQGRVRGWAFVPTVLSSIATSAGLLIILASFYYGEPLGGRQTSTSFFENIRAIAIGLTLVAATILALSLSQFMGGRPLLQGKAAAVIAAIVAILLVVLLMRTIAS